MTSAANIDHFVTCGNLRQLIYHVVGSWSVNSEYWSLCGEETALVYRAQTKKKTNISKSIFWKKPMFYVVIQFSWIRPVCQRQPGYAHRLPSLSLCYTHGQFQRSCQYSLRHPTYQLILVPEMTLCFYRLPGNKLFWSPPHAVATTCLYNFIMRRVSIFRIPEAQYDIDVIY